MSVPIVDVPQMVTDTLNRAGAFTPALNAVRTYELYFDLPEAASAPKISVYPIQDKTNGRSTRNTWKHNLVVGVAIQKKITDDANPEKDVLVALADAICEYLKNALPERSDQRPESLDQPTVQPLIQHPLLRQNKLFSCGVILPFVSHR